MIQTEVEPEGFKTDFDKELYIITITACQGGVKLEMVDINGYKPSIHEIVGALEYMQHHIIAIQREKNLPLAEEYSKKPNP